MSKVAERPSIPGLGWSNSGLEYMFRGLRMDVVRIGRLVEPVLLILGFSFSGGGVGGKTFLFMIGGAL